jgi:hypothetical protein
LAADRDGRVGAFVTAGEAPIPAAVLDAARVSVLEIEERVMTLDPATSARLLVSLPRPDDFVEFARRGLFAYDWTDVHRTSGSIRAYELIAAPESPITIKELPAELVDLIAGVILPVSFADNAPVDVAKWTRCREPNSP